MGGRREKMRRGEGAHLVADLADVSFLGFGPVWAFVDEMLHKQNRI